MSKYAKYARWVALLLGSAFGALALAQSGAGGTVAVVTEANGSILVQAGNGAPRLVKAGGRIPAGAVLLTGADANTVLTFADGQVVVLGERTTLRIVNYRYEPKDISRSADVLQLVAGSARIVMGVIGQHDPRLVRIQVGSGTNFRVAIQDGGKIAAAGVVVEGPATVITVTQGQVLLWPSSGRAILLESGNGMYVQPSGNAQQGSVDQIFAQASQTADGKQIVEWLQAMESFEFSQRSRRTVITLAAPLLFEIPDLPPPAGETTVTAATGGAGGGGGGSVPCPASCN